MHLQLTNKPMEQRQNKLKKVKQKTKKRQRNP